MNFIKTLSKKIFRFYCFDRYQLKITGNDCLLVTKKKIILQIQIIKKVKTIEICCG